MAHYRKVDTCIWNDEKFIALSDRAKLAFMLILTHPNMNSFGCMRATVGGLAAELGWLSEGYTEGYREPFEELFALGLVIADDKSAFLAAPNFLKYNKPANQNVVVSWGKLLSVLPECRTKFLYFQHVTETLKRYGGGLSEALPEGFSNTHSTELITHSSIESEPLASAKPLEISPPTPSIASSDSPATNGTPKGRDKSRRGVLRASQIEIPDSLDTPEVRESLDAWLGHKRTIGKPYKHAESAARMFKQFSTFGRDGPRVFCEAVDFSIGNNYQGLVIPNQNGKPKSNSPRIGPGQLFDPDAGQRDPNFGVL